MEESVIVDTQKQNTLNFELFLNRFSKKKDNQMNKTKLILSGNLFISNEKFENEMVWENKMLAKRRKQKIENEKIYGK